MYYQPRIPNRNSYLVLYPIRWKFLDDPSNLVLHWVSPSSFSSSSPFLQCGHIISADNRIMFIPATAQMTFKHYSPKTKEMSWKSVSVGGFKPNGRGCKSDSFVSPTPLEMSRAALIQWTGDQTNRYPLHRREIHNHRQPWQLCSNLCYFHQTPIHPRIQIRKGRTRRYLDFRHKCRRGKEGWIRRSSIPTFLEVWGKCCHWWESSGYCRRRYFHSCHPRNEAWFRMFNW